GRHPGEYEHRPHLSKVAWYWHRLKAMDASEVVHRVREKYLHRTETRAREALHGLELRHPPQPFPAIPSLTDLPDTWRQQLAADAAVLQEGRWNLYGGHSVKVALPPPWHRDLIHEVNVPSDTVVDHRHLPKN